MTPTPEQMLRDLHERYDKVVLLRSLGMYRLIVRSVGGAFHGVQVFGFTAEDAIRKVWVL
jgi:hypothetical protein